MPQADDLRRPSRRFFDLWSRVYDAPMVQRAVYWPVHDDVVARLRIARAQRVLDLGCGTGFLSARMAADLGATVVGCDYSAGMLSEARARTHDVAWVQGDALHLPLADGSVDAATSTEAFHWFPDPDLALAELARVIRPGGTLLVALVNTRSPVEARVVTAASGLVGQPARWPTRTEMHDRVTAAGFDVAEQHRVRRIGSLAVPTILTVGVRR
jgi:ubiquinone/menaquinone biosynthesis C-methylase UbiE